MQEVGFAKERRKDMRRRRRIQKRKSQKKSDYSIITLLVVMFATIIILKKFPDTFSKEDSISTNITGKTYYVSKKGDDLDEGNESNPFKTITRGIEQLEPGDGLIVKDGVYYEKLTLSKKGSKEKPFIIKADGEVVLDGQGKGGTLLTISSNTSYCSIEGFAFKNLYSVNARGICLKSSSNHIQFLKCSFENIQTPHPAHKYNTANAVYFEGSGKTEEAAIDHILFKGCTATNVGAGWSEVFSIDGNCSNVTIEEITVTFSNIKGNIAICICGNDPETNSNPEVNRPRHIKVTNCVVSGCKSPYGDDAYCIYVDGAYDVLVYGNKLSSSEGGIEVGAEHKTSVFKGKDTEKVELDNNQIIDCKNAIYVGGFNDTSCGYVYDVTLAGNTYSNSGCITLDKCRKVILSDYGIKSSDVKQTSEAKEITIK